MATLGVSAGLQKCSVCSRVFRVQGVWGCFGVFRVRGVLGCSGFRVLRGDKRRCARLEFSGCDVKPGGPARLRVQALQTPPREGRKNENCGGRGKKVAHFPS